MQFIILNRDQMKNYKCDKSHIVISIKDPETKDVKLPYSDMRIGTLRLAFHDFDRVSGDYPGRIRLFNKEDAIKILQFVEFCSKNIDTIICQCEAGISRSAGVAGALSKIINGDDKAIFRHYLPNMLVYRVTLQTAFNEGMYDNYLEYIIERALAKADNMEVKRHHNLLGNKKKYIKAILEALKDV